MAQPRLTWVDLAKVISICLVTSYHTPPPLTGYTAQLIQLLRMPAFFLIAGFLFNGQRFPNLKALLIHRARQLLIPYLAFETLLIGLTCHDGASIREASINALLGHPTVCYPLWFLVCLFGMQVIHYVGLQLTQRLSHKTVLTTKTGLWLLAAYIGICTLLSPLELTQHFQLNAVIVNLPFYAAANCCKPLVRNIEWRQYKTTAACLAGGLLLVALKYSWGEEAGGWLHGAIYYLMHLAAGLLLLPPYIATCKAVGQAIGHQRLVEYLGSNTIVILALHTYYIIIISHLLDLTTVGMWLNPLLTVLIVLGHLPIIWAINRWMPWLLGRGRRTGAQ